MAIVVKDIELTEDNDLLIINGDFSARKSDEMHVEHIMVADKGQYRQSPMIGLGLAKYVNAKFDGILKNKIRRLLSVMLESDGLSIKKLVIDSLSNIQITVQRNKDYMARPITEIYDGIVEAKDRVNQLHSDIVGNVGANPTLSALNSPSQVAIWRLWAFVTACAIWLLEKLFDAHVAEVEAIAARAVPGTKEWYVNRVKEFQYDSVTTYYLTVVNGVPTYNIIDETKRIIKVASLTIGNNGLLIIKAAKDGGGGSYVPLSLPEKNSLDSYVNQIKFAGTSHTIQSNNSDKLRIYADIYFDGVVPLSTIQSNVESAINEYLLNIPFDGQILLNGIIDAVQAVTGVKDMFISVAEATPDYLVTPSYSAITREYQTLAGYIVIDPNFPLSTTLNYVPQ